MDKKQVILLSLRYLFLVLIGLNSLYVFYLIFTPLTFYPSLWIAKWLFDGVAFPGNIIFAHGHYARIIPACVAGAAYYLLTILNFTTPMSVSKRVKSMSYIIIAFLVLNVLRIVLFINLLGEDFKYFDLSHELTWYFGSTILIIIIWFTNIIFFKISAIPIYSDLKNIFSDTKNKR